MKWVRSAMSITYWRRVCFVRGHSVAHVRDGDPGFAPRNDAVSGFNLTGTSSSAVDFRFYQTRGKFRRNFKSKKPH